MDGVKTSASTSKQLLTFQSKSGNSFYPVIDRSGKAALVVILALVLAGGAIYYFLKNKKEKPKTKGPDDHDNCDYSDDAGSPQPSRIAAGRPARLRGLHHAP